MSSPRRLVALVALALLAPSLAACGSKATGQEDEGSNVAAPGAGVSGDPDTWPLTGLPVNGGDSLEKHPVLVLKLDNTASSAPQVGLSSADLVVEELVEGGVTRLAAFYYSDLPGDVGPVRSVRASDIGIVSPVDGHLVTSGGAGVTLRRLEDAGIGLSSEGSPGFYRNSSRSAPYNLFTSLKAVAKDVALAKPSRPADYLPFGAAADLPQGRAASEIAATFSGAHTTTWRFADGGYTNVDGFAADGDEFPADSVLVLRVDVGDAGYRDPAGNPVPETRFRGSGAALLFHDGRVVQGTWHKPDLASVLTLKTPDGPLTVPAGRTWIELVPKDGGSVSYQ